MSRPNQVRPPGNLEGDTEDHAGSEVNDIIPPADIAPAYIVIVVSPYGTPRRRPYLNLHHATAAVSRARGKGQQAWLILCKLEPVATDPELGWSE